MRCGQRWAIERADSRPLSLLPLVLIDRRAEM
jgi:hypothetical protein